MWLSRGGHLLQINPLPEPLRLTGQLSVTRSTSLDLGTRSYQKRVTSLTVARSVKVSYRGLAGAKRGQECTAFCACEGEGASKEPETTMGQGQEVLYDSFKNLQLFTAVNLRGKAD